MPENFVWDRVFATASWCIVIALLVGVVTLFFVPPGGAGPVAQLIGSEAARWFYITVYGSEAVVLGYSKVYKRKNLRKKALVAIYLTALFTSILTLLLSGFGVTIIDNLVLVVLAAGCWLYWKFKTEYVDPRTFQKSLEPLRDDLLTKP